jgi:N-acetylglucosamine-6-phosphate deacetylase
MAHSLLQNGVTGFLPTSLTVSWDMLESICRHIRELAKESDSPEFSGSQILGMHMEGPFINPSKKGAQNEAYILRPDAQKVLPFADVIRVITFAPEMPGGMEFTKILKEKTSIALSIGHTSATFNQAMDAIHLGVMRATHTFNAMTGLHHRDPGVVGAALTSDIYTELIADTFHVNKAIFPLMAKLKGDHLVLITDALRSAGMPDGEYENGGQIFVLKGIECRLQDGTIAGSVLRLNNAVKNLRDYACLPMYQAVRAASLNAAMSANLADHKGSLAPGKDADIVLLDDECRVLKTIVKGTVKYEA